MQAIRNPAGISVFGSAQVRAAPDVAEITLAVTRLAPTPAAAFRAASDAASKVSTFLAGAGLRSSAVSTSRATLRQAHREGSREREVIGYRASIGFAVVLDDLDRVQEVLTGAIDAGADVLEGLTFRSRAVAELRAEARRRAIDAARRKAGLYAEAAGVAVGGVIHIEDRDPELLSRESSYHVRPTPDEDEDAPDGPTPPGSIAVAGAVTVVFAILPKP